MKKRPSSAGRSREPRTPEDRRFYFDAEAADRAVAFISTLTLRTGDPPGQDLVLMPWQEGVVRKLFGWRVRETGRRRYRRVSIWIPRGNGKTPFAAAIMLCILFTDPMDAAELYSVAADREQAQISFDDGAYMRREAPELQAVSSELRRSITYTKRGSVWKVVSSDAKTKHGTRPSVVLFDELHTQKNDRLWAAFETGLTKKRDSLLITISTAGVYDPKSLAWREYLYAKRVSAGIIDDPTFLPLIFEASEEDDPFSRETWAKCNPGLGITLFEEGLETEALKAKEDAAALAAFKQLHLNIWVNAAEAAIGPDVWAKNEAPLVIIPRMKAWAGLDVGERNDLCGLALWLPNEDGRHSVAIESFMPSLRVLTLQREHNVPYLEWINQGWIWKSGANNVDTDDVRKRLNSLREIYDIQQVAHDAWNATQLTNYLANEDGFECVEIPQQMKHLSEPTKSFLALLSDGLCRFGDNPVARWMASNLELQRDTKGNVMYTKANRAAKIDGIAAAIMAWKLARMAIGEVDLYALEGGAL